MTTAETRAWRPTRETSTAGTPPSDGAAPQAPDAFVLRWLLGRRSLAGAGVLNSATGRDALLEIEIVRSPTGWDASARLLADDLDAPRELAPRRNGASVRYDANTDLWHVHADGLLMASLELDGEQGRLLFGRTPLLAGLGLPGGRYEPAGIAARR